MKYITTNKAGMSIYMPPVIQPKVNFDRIFVPTWLFLIVSFALGCWTVSNFQNPKPNDKNTIQIVADNENEPIVIKKIEIEEEVIETEEFSIFNDDLIVSKTIKDALERDSVAIEKTCLKLYNDYQIVCDRTDLVKTLWTKTKAELLQMGLQESVINKYNPVAEPKPKTDKLVFGAYNEAEAKRYISKYLPFAKIQENKHGIPAAITIAQGLHESNAGRSRLARENNNHFGIKCFNRSCKKGHCTNHHDDSHKDFFRKFKTVEVCFNARAKFLKKKRYLWIWNNPTYAKYKQVAIQNDRPFLPEKKWNEMKLYEKQCNGLYVSGYATDLKYSSKLINTIKNYNLQNL